MSPGTAAPGSAPAVRDGEPADLPAVADLVRGACLPLDGLDEVWRLVVATDAGRLVAAAALERHGSGADTALLLRSVVVAPSHRGTGLGALLVRHLLAVAAREHPRAPVALLTETAGDWFPRLGFSPVGRAALPRALSASVELASACPANALAMLRTAPGA